MFDREVGGEGPDRFQETAWSIVLAAGNASEPRAHQALAELCRTYWPPVYAYLRRRGYNRDDAQDLTQKFFEHMLEEETLRRASPDRGRFRSFLLGALNRVIADEWAHDHAQRRGGNAAFISMDDFATEEAHHRGLTSDLSPAETLDARRAGVLLQRALEKVKAEFSAEGKAKTFEALAPFLAGEKTGSHLPGSNGAAARARARGGEDAHPPVTAAIRDRCPPRDHANRHRTA